MFSNLVGASKEPSQGTDDETSLTTILSTPALRVEFTLLIMLCTNKMRDNVSAIFDASQISSPTPSAAQSPAAVENLISLDDEPPNYDAATKGRGRRDYDRREEELLGFEMRQLRKDALTYFNTWRNGVLKRVGKVLSVRADTVLREKDKRDKEEARAGPLELDEEQQGQHYTPISTRLVQLDEANRVLILNSMLLLLLSLEHYQAHSRVLLLHVTSSLRLPSILLTEHENKIAQGLLAAAEAQMNADKETKKKAAEGSAERAWKVGLATVAGAALIGVTGGLAAPLLAAGAGTILGGLGLTGAAGLLGSLLGNVVLIGGLFGAYGGKMTGKMMEQYAKEVEDFKFIPLRQVSQDEHRLRVAIAVSGWLTEKEEIVEPWGVLGNSIEAFALRWELDVLLRLGTSLAAVLKSYAWDYAKVEIIQRTLLGSLAAGLWPLGLLRVCRVIDNPFSVAKARSDKAGEVLAAALMNKAQGERPVTLVGYSLGARVIYSCLQSLAKHKAFGLVESVVVLGAPTPSDTLDWRRIRAVVSGRVVNVFSTNDHILGFLYRTSSIQYGVAGLQKVEDVFGVENVDVSELISGHMAYRYSIGAILERIGFPDLDPEGVKREAHALQVIEEKEDKARKSKEAKKEAKRKEGEMQAKRHRNHGLRPTEVEARDAKAFSFDDIDREVEALKIKETRMPEAGRSVARHTVENTYDEDEPHEGRITMIDAEEEAEDLEMEVAARLASKKEGETPHREALTRPLRQQTEPMLDALQQQQQQQQLDSESESEMLHLAPEPELDLDGR